MGLKFRRRRSSSSKQTKEIEKLFEYRPTSTAKPHHHSLTLQQFHSTSKRRSDTRVFLLSEPLDSVPQFRDYAATSNDGGMMSVNVANRNDTQSLEKTTTCSMSTDPILGNFSKDSFGLAKERIDARVGDSGLYTVDAPQPLLEDETDSSIALEARDEEVSHNSTRNVVDVQHDEIHIEFSHMDDIPDHDSGVVLGGTTIESGDGSNNEQTRKGTGMLHIFQSIFGRRTSKQDVYDIDDDSVSDDGSHPDLKVVEFDHGQSLENTSTLSDSSGSDSDNSTVAEDKDKDEDDNGDDNSEDLFGADSDDGWDEAILNCMACAR